MFGFLRRQDLDSALAQVKAEMATTQAEAKAAVALAEEMHEQTRRLIKRYDARAAKERREEEDWPEEPGDAVSDRVNERRASRGRRIRAV